MATFSIPKTMKGVLIEKTGGVEVLLYKTDLPVPVPKEGEILVKNEYIGVNYIDTYFRTGLYPSPKPEILGREAASTVISLGPSPTPPAFTPGDRVVFLGTSTYAEYSVAPASKVIKIPTAISSQHACAAILQGLTALTLIEEAVDVKRGDWVLVHAAAGGVGGWLCQILRAKGIRTVATAGTEAKRLVARRSGADVAVGYERKEVLDAVFERTAGEGVRAVFDGVGRETWALSLEAVARKGTVASFGNASGAVEPFRISELAAKNVKICRPTLYNYLYTREELDTYVEKLWKLMVEDKFEVPIHEVYDLKDVARAHTDIESRKTMGKLLLRP